MNFEIALCECGMLLVHTPSRLWAHVFGYRGGCASGRPRGSSRLVVSGRVWMDMVDRWDDVLVVVGERRLSRTVRQVARSEMHWCLGCRWLPGPFDDCVCCGTDEFGDRWESDGRLMVIDERRGRR